MTEAPHGHAPGAYYSGRWAEIHHGDCAEVLAEFPENTFSAIISDPPYGLSEEPRIEDVLSSWLAGEEYEPACGSGGFMNAGWDTFLPGPVVWKEILRVLKPGGFLLAFAGTRTRDYLGLALRLAGFRIEDSIEWLNAQGHPTRNRRAELAMEQETGAGSRGERRRAHGMVPLEGHESAGAYRGRGTALKPAHESILVAKKPIAKRNLARNLLAHGTGSMGIDACRIEGAPGDGVWGASNETVSEERMLNSSPGMTSYRSERHPKGRYPANVVLSCCDPAEGEDRCFSCPVAELDEQSGVRKSGANPSRRASDKFRNVYSHWKGQQQCEPARGESVGGASRFYFCAKASRSEKEVGLEDMPRRPLRWSSGSANPGSFQSSGTRKAARNFHPTTKPVELMRWLIRLVVPDGGLVLDPFAGSGTTAVAATSEGIRSVLVEREACYLAMARARAEHAANTDVQARAGLGISRSATRQSASARGVRPDGERPNGEQVAEQLALDLEAGGGSLQRDVAP